ncbi:MAG: beta-N-acetylglucosaminidase domain-containing protein [Candidatus Puniceispirillum sp.]|nr:beta-N-acetylglucosaminidase domain-containing protein [Candidatus Puniceispirillum sp.]MBL6774499.1 beta-N-acetylglucosaminidase domain-containing protein [Candidatus Puniceispirillum sp.]
MTLNFTGYIEGYYGRLLSWHDRERLLDGLKAAGMTSYFYAPKEDVCHRYLWRQPYDAAWQASFATFTANAAAKNICVIAGIAPGLDFDFAALDDASTGANIGAENGVNDFVILLEKARHLLADGAYMIALLMDDIAADFDTRCGGFASEGRAHAVLANRLGAALGAAVMLVPRIYADSLITIDDPQSLTYLDDLVGTLDPQHPVVYCGDDIVAPHPAADAGGRLDPASSIIWDNFYANDYCPRRLFVGPWRASRAAHLLTNPTGMIETDLLLLAMMAAGRDAGAQNCRTNAGIKSWRRIISDHCVPSAFFDIAAYFDAPYGFAAAFELPLPERALVALDILLWQWKSPLQREWYPYLMGLKQDIMLADGQLPRERIEKTHLAPLATKMIGNGF